MSINTVTLSGRLTRDPEVRYSQAGTAILNNGIAVEEYVKDGENGVSFINFTVFGAYAEMLVKKLKKGDNLSLSGRLRQRSWEAEDGTKRSAVEVVARDLVGEFIFRKDGENGTSTPTPEADVPLDGDISPPEADQTQLPAADDDIPF